LTLAELTAFWRSARRSADRSDELRLCAVMASVYAIVGVQLPFLPIWLGARGFDATEIAALLAAPPAIRIFSTLVSSRIADRWRRHGAVLVVHLFGSALAFALLGLTCGFLATLAAIALLAMAQGPVNSLADGMVLGEARQRRLEGRGTLHYSFIRGFGSLAILVVLLASGPVAAAIPNGALIWLIGGVALAAAISAFLATSGLAGAGARRETDVAEQPLEKPVLVAIVVAAATLILVSQALSLGFASLHWKAKGFDDGFVSLGWSAALLTEVAFFFLAARWFGGERNAALHLSLSGAAAVARWLWMASDPGALGILSAQAMHGLTCGAAQLGPAYLLARLAGPTRLAQAQGWLAAAYAAGLSLTTLACGPLYSRYGESSYLAMAAMAASGFVLSLAVKRAIDREERAPAR